MADTGGIDVERPRCRAFGLGDVMILIVALALGCMIARPLISPIVAVIQDISPSDLGGPATVAMGRLLSMVLVSFLGFLLPAFLILRLRRPRPPLGSLINQPGFAGCALTVTLFTGLGPLSLLIPDDMGQIVEMAALVLRVAAPPLAWVILIATRRWAPEPGWIDRLGRGLGATWTVLMMLLVVLFRLP